MAVNPSAAMIMVPPLMAGGSFAATWTSGASGRLGSSEHAALKSEAVVAVTSRATVLRWTRERGVDMGGPPGAPRPWQDGSRATLAFRHDENQ